MRSKPVAGAASKRVDFAIGVNLRSKAVQRFAARVRSSSDGSIDGSLPEAEQRSRVSAEDGVAALRRERGERASDQHRRLERRVDVRVVRAPKDPILADELEHRADRALFGLRN